MCEPEICTFFHLAKKAFYSKRICFFTLEKAFLFSPPPSESESGQSRMPICSCTWDATEP